MKFGGCSFLAGLFLVSCDCGENSFSSGGEPAKEKEVVKWQVLDPADWQEVQFGGEGATQWSEGVLHLDTGVELTGTRYAGDNLPSMPYELELEARKVAGSDFFCGLTFPVSSNEECLTFVVGGWGGGTVGMSSIDGRHADDNDTTSYDNFEDGRWYHIRVRVEEGRLAAFIDEKQVVTLSTVGRRLGLRPGAIENCAPLGLASFQTEAEVRNLRWRSLAD